MRLLKNGVSHAVSARCVELARKAKERKAPKAKAKASSAAHVSLVVKSDMQPKMVGDSRIQRKRHFAYLAKAHRSQRRTQRSGKIFETRLIEQCNSMKVKTLSESTRSEVCTTCTCKCSMMH